MVWWMACSAGVVGWAAPRGAPSAEVGDSPPVAGVQQSAGPAVSAGARCSAAKGGHRRRAVDAAGVSRVEAAGHARHQTGFGERVFAVDEQGRRSRHARLGGYGLVIEYAVGDRHIDLLAGDGLRDPALEQLYVGAVGNLQDLQLHRFSPSACKVGRVRNPV
jgi:hypothetical protein